MLDRGHRQLHGSNLLLRDGLQLRQLLCLDVGLLIQLLVGEGCQVSHALQHAGRHSRHVALRLGR